MFIKRGSCARRVPNQIGLAILILSVHCIQWFGRKKKKEKKKERKKKKKRRRYFIQSKELRIQNLSHKEERSSHLQKPNELSENAYELKICLNTNLNHNLL